MGFSQIFLFFILVIFAFATTKIGAKVPAIIVFGDSSVDSGNNNVIKTLLKSNFRPYGRDFFGGQPTGRFSNGRVPPDFISQAFGLKPAVPAYLDPAFTIADFATGVCFASAGTGFDNSTSDVLNVIPLWREVEFFKDYQSKLRAYLGNDKAKEVIREALYLVSLGTNDFLENYYTIPRRRLEFNSVEQFEEFLLQLAGRFIGEIYGLGVRKVSLTGLPPMGCLPLQRATNVMSNFDCVEKYNLVALEFNGKLEGFVREMNRQLPGLRMVFSNPYPIFYEIITKPYLYGFEVAGKACCGTGTFEMSYLCNQESSFTCPDATKYVFWDAFHPTQKTNQIIVDHLLTQLLPMFH